MAEQVMTTVPVVSGHPAEEVAAEEAVDPELLIKHPLQNTWALWYFKNDKRNNWLDNQKIITTFSTVEDFWALFNYIQPASKLAPGCDYSMFKDGIQPMWEDERNKRGGRWLINLDKRKRGAELDRFWLETVLCLIGEAFDECSEEICGAVINIRPKGDKLGLWTRDCTQRDANIKIGKVFKSRLNFPPDVVIDYEAHADTMSKSGSMAKNKYSV
jgi:translation initiation factor 4E